MCSLPGTVSGDVGDVRSNILTARVRDDEGNTASRTVQADVVISNVNPVFRVLKTAAPATMPEPGGPVTFTVTLINDSRENVTIDSFVDVPYGNLNGKGTCRLPQTLTPSGGFYTCTFRETVTGTARLSPYVDTVTAKVSDNDGEPGHGLGPGAGRPHRRQAQHHGHQDGDAPEPAGAGWLLHILDQRHQHLGRAGDPHQPQRRRLREHRGRRQPGPHRYHLQPATDDPRGRQLCLLRSRRLVHRQPQVPARRRHRHRDR